MWGVVLICLRVSPDPPHIRCEESPAVTWCIHRTRRALSTRPSLSSMLPSSAMVRLSPLSLSLRLSLSLLSLSLSRCSSTDDDDDTGPSPATSHAHALPMGAKGPLSLLSALRSALYVPRFADALSFVFRPAADHTGKKRRYWLVLKETIRAAPCFFLRVLAWY